MKNKKLSRTERIHQLVALLLQRPISPISYLCEKLKIKESTLKLYLREVLKMTYDTEQHCYAWQYWHNKTIKFYCMGSDGRQLYQRKRDAEIVKNNQYFSFAVKQAIEERTPAAKRKKTLESAPYKWFKKWHTAFAKNK